MSEQAATTLRQVVMTLNSIEARRIEMVPTDAAKLTLARRVPTSVAPRTRGPSLTRGSKSCLATAFIFDTGDSRATIEAPERQAGRYYFQQRRMSCAFAVSIWML